MVLSTNTSSDSCQTARLTRWPCRRARRKIKPTTVSPTMAEAIAVGIPDPISTTPTRGR